MLHPSSAPNRKCPREIAPVTKDIANGSVIKLVYNTMYVDSVQGICFKLAHYVDLNTQPDRERLAPGRKGVGA